MLPDFNINIHEHHLAVWWNSEVHTWEATCEVTVHKWHWSMSLFVGYNENSRSDLSHIYILILSKLDSKLTVHIYYMQ